MKKLKAISIGEIKNKINSMTLNEQLNYISELALDSRKGVLNIIEAIKKKEIKNNVELKRLDIMEVYEKNLRSKNITLIVGIDEVGRGPLAGPVLTCAVILPVGHIYYGINDSKKVSKKLRESLFKEIAETAIDFSFGIASPEEIDKYNILNATKLAMKRAVDGLSIKPEHLLIDAVKLDDINISQTSIIKGDEKSVSIAAASILAKVKRDEIMVEYSKKYVGYGFENNKGYGTAEHYVGLNSKGITEIHRRSFVRDFL